MLNPHIYNIIDWLGVDTNNEIVQMLLFVWQKFPYILVGGLLLFGFVASQRRDPNYY